MITSINEYRKIYERRQQQVIPFEEPEYGVKHIYGHIEDALIDLSVMKPADYYSDGNPTDEIDNVRDTAFDFMLKGDGDDETVHTEYVWQFTQHYDPNSDPEMYSGEFVKYAISEDDECMEDMLKFAELAAKESDIRNVFSDDGWKQFKRVALNIFNSEIRPMEDAVTASYDNSELGLIECWRVVDYVDDGKGDYYVNIMAHGGVGVYWSWDENAADSHNGNSSGHSITLHGLISVEDVHWYDTTWKSAYMLKDEKEIRTNNDSKIMVVGFHDNKADKYVELDSPIVVRTGQ